ncbi:MULTISPECIES: ABC transporter permease [Amycolatopsis]|uniref:ABC-2 family transporter protein n=2 Tax=Amycolatopsis TaxID=1813 RepID=A0A1I3KE32_9PSEU|nr:ABC transporter permease [Amycolatopsis sacchari]SFI70776.1 ABC-2 family transporter protein [Amycolatopsis sacchari]
MTTVQTLVTGARRWRADVLGGTTWQAALLRAVGFETAQHLRNRLALTLVVFFIPVWLAIVRTIIPARPVAYLSRITDAPITVDAGRLALISAVLNATTLIIGFMLFATVRRAREFDQRLVLAGYPRPCLLLAKLIGLGLVALTVGGYATIVLSLYTDVRQPGLLFLSLVAGGLVYGGLGIALGVAVSTELAGMFVIIMVSLVDVMVQNPVINPGRNQTVLQFLPTYGPMQSAVAATFTDTGSFGYLMLGPLWLLVFALFGLSAFYLRTKDHTRSEADAPTAAVTVRLLPDGTFEIESRRGPVVVQEVERR